VPVLGQHLIISLVALVAMTDMKKPAILLVHGAWHRPLHYIHIIHHLRALGYTVLAPSLATAGYGSQISGRTIADDVKVIRKAIAPHLDNGEEVVMVCHSYGGLVGTDSIIGNTVVERKEKGLAGGIKAMVYVAAFAPPEGGLRLFDLVRMKDESEHPDWWCIEVS
jgi:alpha-beta hydrolase superfamily lysophospholipase